MNGLIHHPQKKQLYEAINTLTAKYKSYEELHTPSLKKLCEVVHTHPVQQRLYEAHHTVLSKNSVVYRLVNTPFCMYYMVSTLYLSTPIKKIYIFIDKQEQTFYCRSKKKPIML